MGKDQDLLEAARNGNIGVVCKLLEQTKRNRPLSSFRRSLSINVQDMNGYTPLHHACLNGHSNIVRLLLTHNAKTDVPDVRGSTPLFLAAWAGHHDIVKMLLMQPNSPANPNFQTIENETPLHCAAQHGHNVALSILLAYGADPTIRNNSFQTALDLASQFGRLQAVQILIRTHPELIEPFKAQGASDSGCSSPYATTPTKHIFTHSCLHLASRNGHKKVVETLLTAGVDPNILTTAGTALHEAALCGKKSVVRTLLHAGVNIKATDSSGRTALDILNEYPPHVTYEIVSVINDFCNENITDSHSTLDTASSKFDETEIYENLPYPNSNMRDKSNTMPADSYDRKYKNSSEILNKSQTSILSSQRLATKKSGTGKEMDTSISNGANTIRNYHCVDDYVKMTAPSRSGSSTPSTPIPSPRLLKSNDYANLNFIVNSVSSPKQMPKESTVILRRPLLTDANNNKEHSPTPDFPPPTVVEAENTIFEYIHPLDKRLKRRSIKILSQDLEDLEYFSLENINEEDSIGTPNSPASDYVEEFVGDEPFAGLFKGSTVNLANGGNDEDSSYIVRQSVRLRSPSLVRSIKPFAADWDLPTESSRNTMSIGLNETKVWDEITTILESIGNEVSDVENFSKSLEKVEKKSEIEDESVLVIKDNVEIEKYGKMETGAEIAKNLTTEEKSPSPPPSQIKIRNPSDLLLGIPQDLTTNWCHSANTLIYGQIMYDVYYLGSTVVRVMFGTASTRKSIQKFKRGETLLEKDDEAGFLKDCKSSTKFLKSSKKQTRLKVGIALSCVGVKFIDNDNKSTFCMHDIENINCVCQDAEDLRYFAYITKEKDIHYCHVFLVDNVELATEIILTLAQAFEVAYQLAMKKEKVLNLVEKIDSF